jgi:hypothetical protein
MMLASTSTSLADAGGGLVDFEQGHVHAAGDVDQHALGALHRDFVEQRVGDRASAAISARSRPRLARAHHRLAHLAHDGADVGEVEVDQARHDHQVGDAAHARIEHLVGHPKASAKVVFSLAMRNRFWFGMTISVST